jgi:hypothetical protein
VHKEARLGFRQRLGHIAKAEVDYAIGAFVEFIALFRGGRGILDTSLLLPLQVDVLRLRDRLVFINAAALVFLPAPAGAGIVATDLQPYQDWRSRWLPAPAFFEMGVVPVVGRNADSRIFMPAL